MLIDFRDLAKEYNLSFSGVLHVGANVGEEAPVYRDMGINKQVWIEPNKDLIHRLESNVHNYPGVYAYVLNVCAGNENKTVTLHISNNAGQSSSILELGTHKIAHPEVSYIEDQEVLMVRLEDFLMPQVIEGLDFLNIDVQGAELMVLQGLGRYVDQFKMIYLEVNKEELYKECALIDSIDLFMTAHRFMRVETHWAGNTGWGDSAYIKD